MINTSRIPEAGKQNAGAWAIGWLVRALMALMLGTSLRAAEAEVDVVLVGPRESVENDRPVAVWVHLLNPSAAAAAVVSVPGSVAANLMAESRVFAVTLELERPAEAGPVTVAPGTFLRRKYLLALPKNLAGTVLVTVPQWETSAIGFHVQPTRRIDPVVIEDSGQSSFAQFQDDASPPQRTMVSPGQFFKEHFFGYEPFYFIVGPDSPNAKFQISLRYQLLNRHGRLAQQAPLLKGFNVAYTQRSLWDLTAPSSPFLDSNYLPEMFYLWQRVDAGRWADWFRLDLQGGMQHESNGKGGDDSRSLNILYFAPTVVFGLEDGFQARLSPRVWAYVGDLDDNPDLPDYRGYGDLRLTLGWPRNLQVTTTGRLGKDWDRGSLQFDLTYPMMRLLSGSFSVYLHAQYFTGYGESLLMYNERTDGFRAGFSLFR